MGIQFISGIVRLLGATLPLLALVACSIGPQTFEGPAADIRALTGARTRVVWVQGDGSDPYAAGDRLTLMGFDTDDGRGERVILAELNSYVKPLLTPRGDRIIFSRRPGPDGPQVFGVDWNGAGLQRLAPGFALAVWRDPADGREWVYIGTDNRRNPYDFHTVTRVRIDDPNVRELVWNKTQVSGDTFQVSADGRLAGGMFPWPDAGVAELPNGSWKRYGEGCWTALADAAGTRLFWYFDGSHRNLSLVDVGADTRWMVNINQVPGFRNDEVYHPRWTNHPRFLTISGPYNLGGPDANKVRGGGRQTEIHLGRFSADYTRVEAWARVTYNSGGDSYPDVWIDRNRSSHPVRAAGPVGPAQSASRPPGTSGSATTAAAGRIVVEARLVRAGSIPSPQAIAPYRHALVTNVYEILRVVEGAYGERRLVVAQWAIRDGRVLAGARKTVGTVHRLTLERYDAHPELEGERLVTEGDVPDVPLYYEVGAS